MSKRKLTIILIIATIATIYYGNIGPDGLAESLLDIVPKSTNTALVGTNSVIIIDKNGKPIDTNEE